jgi:hypothetical protein
MSKQPNAASTKNIRIRSSSAVRLITKCRPSTASNSPAVQPSTVDPVSRRAIRAIISTESVPRRATANRHPKGSRPNNCSPTEMIHFPAGGWTTKAGLPLKTFSLPSRIN